jgi:hypothetical protein
MTDDRRRAEDVYQIVVGLTTRFDEFVALRERVASDGDVERMADEHRQLVADMPTIKQDLGELGDAVLGTRKSEFQGGGRHEDGLTHDVADIRMKVNGGGLSQADMWRLRVSTGASVLTFIGVIVAAFIVS